METTCTPLPPDPSRLPTRPGSRSSRRRHGLRVVLGTAALLAAVAAPELISTPASAGQLTFPYRNDFSSAAGGTASGDAVVTGGALRLTEDATDQAGAWSTDDTFPSDAGLDISFRYDTGKVGPGLSADGLVLTLSDGSAAQGVGQYGAGLGYACRNSGNEGAHACDLPGLPGAFAAVALDQYGNFSLPFNESGPGQRPDSVVVRGSGNGTSGYRYVAGKKVDWGLDTDGSWRTVRVVVRPGASDSLRITVQVSDGTEVRTVLAGVDLGGGGQAPLPETLRLGFAGSTGSSQSLHRVDSLVVRQPVDVSVAQDLPPAVAGQEWSYSVHVENPGVNASSPSPVHVDVPDGLEGATWTCTPSGGATCGADSGNGDVDASVSLPPGGSADFVVTGTLPPDAEGELVSAATIDPAEGLVDVRPADNASTESTPVTSAASMRTDKSVATIDGAEGVAPGDDVEYTVTAVNDGPSVAQQVRVDDDLPDELTFVGSDDGCTADGQRVTCGGEESLAPGDERAWRFRATLDAAYTADGSDVVNVAVSDSPTDPDGGDPSPEVPLPPVRTTDPDEPEHPRPTPSPTSDAVPVAPTAPADPGDGATPDAGAPPAGDPPRRTGALAYTGSESVAALLALAVCVTLGGLLAVGIGRRRRSAADRTVRAEDSVEDDVASLGFPE